MARYKQRKRRAPRRKAPAKRRAPPRRSKPKAPKYRRETITQLRRENGAEYTRERYSTAAMRCQVQKGHHYNKMKEAEREGEEERGEEAKQRQDLKSLMKRIVRDTGLKEVLQN